ncbi:arsenite efflux transporter metallochaperone ArsD [Alkalicoccus daliensis]|uniref:Arsenical resistance operon trans-acting repressor ArsD n=1 Tax=Alkalicoccus daliensis TaxID=745820 RepID=A0A1H0IRW7_9BACI|nr:arsenite efflux transporter metallochaperone ArsD [Alkalicoccus daliensis]SDO34207.1 Arsenical resistance operon trans-acting repressor ArsD [Alkalicoccus daliensis]
MKTHIEIFDPALCCSTGVCGPDVDPALTRMAKLHTDLQKQGYEVSRYNLAQEPQPFVENKLVNDLLHAEGPEALPAVLVDGELKKHGEYPTLSELAAWLNVAEEKLKPVQPKKQINLL